MKGKIKPMRKERAMKARVKTLLNAISDLHKGDLQTVLELDGTAPMELFGNKTGAELSQTYEQNLEEIMGLGEATQYLFYKNRRRNAKQFGSFRY